MTKTPKTIFERDRLILVSSLAIFVLVGYFSLVLLFGNSFFGFEFRVRELVILMLGSIALVILLCLVISTYAPKYLSVATNIQVSILTTVLSLVVVDIAYQLVQNAQELEASPHGEDPNYMVGEFYPRLYFPTKKNLRIHKPSMAVTASAFGNFYSSNMLRSPTLVNSVLQRRTVSISINDFGFREAEPIENARIFALGDSLTFGWGVNADKTWVKQLEYMLSTPIYNLGVHDASPKQELELLKFLVTDRKPSISVQHVLWMIYEGNDLEDNYSEIAAAEEWQSLLRATILESIIRLPYLIKQESIITKLLEGRIQSRYADGGLDFSHSSVDGIPLVHPLFKSDILGYKLFYRPYVDRVQQPRSYVSSHPNRPKLETVFKEMGELARNSGFDVCVILAPTDARLQGKYFAGFPKISDEPYFLRFVASLARNEHFQVIDLYDALRPVADQKLLYFRDDDHWNEDGNLLVASVLAKQFSLCSRGLEPRDGNR